MHRVSALQGLAHFEEVLAQNTLHETDLSGLFPTEETSLCVQEAVSELMDQCVAFGVDGLSPAIRRTLAARLAVCEFLDAGIAFPESCRKTSKGLSYDLCIRDLEKQPQFWTSYSGHYRETHRLCHERALPYAKDQIVSLYYNITRLYGAIYENLQRAYSDSEDARRAFQERFEELSVLMQTLIVQTQRELEDSRESAAQFRDEFKEMLSETSILFAGYSEDSSFQVEEVLVLLRFLSGQFSDLSAAFEDQSFTKKLQEMKGSFMSEYQAATHESGMVLSAILAQLQAANLVSGEAEEAAKRTSLVVKENQELSESLKNGLQMVALDLRDQRRVLRTEYEHLVVELSEVFLALLADYGDHVERETDALSFLFRDLDSKFQKTLATVDALDAKLLGIAASFNSSLLGLGVKIASLTYGVTRKIKETQLWRKFSETISFFKGSLLWAFYVGLAFTAVFGMLLLWALQERVWGSHVVQWTRTGAKYAGVVLFAGVMGELLVQVCVVQ